MAETNEESRAETLDADEAAMAQMLMDADALRRGRTDSIIIDGKRWKLRALSQRQSLKMQNLDFDVLYWQRRLKDAPTARKAKRLNAKIRRAYAKKAAHKVLGRWLWLVPGLFALTWRWIYNQSERVSATINSTEAIGEGRGFYLANLGTSRQALALCMTQVGESAKQRRERRASAESMLDEDASPGKQEDGKSARRSGSRTTTSA